MTQALAYDDGFDQICVPLPEGEGSVILVRCGDSLRAWRNRCPHLGLELDWGDGRCLFDGALVCAMHGARFQPHDGLCVAGPCRGQSLEPLAVEVVDGQIRIVEG